jgi:hypothetical protein
LAAAPNRGHQRGDGGGNAKEELVWVPAGIYLLAVGSPGAAVVELVWGALVVVGFSDHVIRPRLVGDEGMPAISNDPHSVSRNATTERPTTTIAASVRSLPVARRARQRWWSSTFCQWRGNLNSSGSLYALKKGRSSDGRAVRP